MKRRLPFLIKRSVCSYKVFQKYAAELLSGYPVDEETIQWIYALLRDDDVYHAFKELRPYMDVDQARDTVCELKAWMEGRA